MNHIHAGQDKVKRASLEEELGIIKKKFNPLSSCISPNDIETSALPSLMRGLVRLMRTVALRTHPDMPPPKPLEDDLVSAKDTLGFLHRQVY